MAGSYPCPDAEFVKMINLFEAAIPFRARELSMVVTWDPSP